MMNDPGAAYADQQFELRLLPGELSVSRLPPDAPVPQWYGTGAVHGILFAPDELTVICASEAVPASVLSERGWRCLQVRGPLDFNQIGVLAALSAPLAKSGVSIFSISSFDTDYVLVKAAKLEVALQALRAAGHRIVAA